MPNWCKNRVDFYSENKEDLNKVLDIFSNKESIFGQIIPEPDWKTTPNDKGELPIKEEIKNSDGEIVAETYNFPDGKNDDRWYHWCVDNWGTKWDMCDKFTAEIDEGWAEFGFMTAWAPPSGIYDKIVEDFPDVGISWFYDEPGCEVAGYLPN